MRQYSLFDKSLYFLQDLKKSLIHNTSNNSNIDSIRIMRVNYSGEICAQGLYLGHISSTRDIKLQQYFQKAAAEEMEHLTWCKDRLSELNGSPSKLNPIWSAGSFAIGFLAGLAGKKWSLGFLAETEQQVTKHLDRSLSMLPNDDDKSRLILQKMRIDELSHANNAIAEGAKELPKFIKKFMALTAKVMTTFSYYI